VGVGLGAAAPPHTPPPPTPQTPNPQSPKRFLFLKNNK